MGVRMEVLSRGDARVHGAGVVSVDPFGDDGVEDAALAASQCGG